MTAAYYRENMKSLTVRLPDQLVREIEAESRERDCAKSDVVRERLQRGARPASGSHARLNLVADLIGSVDGLPADERQKEEVFENQGLWQEACSLMLVL
jgi:Arc/MetJ-type ribon-helix-helix transcriptional regulator